MNLTAHTADIGTEEKADCICGTFFYAGGAAPAILGIFDVRFAVFVSLDKTSGADIATLLQPMHLDLSITMLILFTSRYKVTNNNFYLAVFKTGINILVKVPVILSG